MDPLADPPQSTLTRAGLRTETAGDGGVWVSGATFARRELLKAQGAVWSRERQAWRLASTDALGRFADALAGQPEPTPGLAEEAPASFAGWGTKHYHGHRERLRQRFTEVSPEALADYELLELLLFFSVYRRDTKPIAKDLIERFGSLGGVLAADPARYAESTPLTTPAPTDPERRATRDEDLRFTQVLLKTAHALFQRVLKEQIKERPVIGSWTSLIEYLQLAMQHEPAEHFRILF